MQHLQPITYEDITAALIAGLRIGRLTAARRANGETNVCPGRRRAGRLDRAGDSRSHRRA